HTQPKSICKLSKIRYKYSDPIHYACNYTIINIRDIQYQSNKNGEERCIMADVKVERLLINYKTLEDFKRFQAYRTQELTMFEDLENEIVENDSDSPFYCIFYGNNLVARMSLYQRSKKYDDYFNPPQDYVVLFKLEVLPAYRTKGYGKLLVDYAKGFQQPIKTNP